MPTKLFEVKPIEISSTKEVEDIFIELANTILKAEKKADAVQKAINSTPTAAINQLRYAGYHLSQALIKSKLFDTPALLDHSNLLSAYKHALRAYYDSLDHISILVTQSFHDVENLYTELLIPISQHFPEYENWRIELDNLSNLRHIAEEVSLYEYARTEITRKEFYELIDPKIEIVLLVYKRIPIMNDKLSVLAQIAQREKDDRKKAEERAEKAEERAKKSEEQAKKSYYVALCGIAIAFMIFLFGNNTTQPLLQNSNANSIVTTPSTIPTPSIKTP